MQHHPPTHQPCLSRNPPPRPPPAVCETVRHHPPRRANGIQVTPTSMDPTHPIHMQPRAVAVQCQQPPRLAQIISESPLPRPWSVATPAPTTVSMPPPFTIDSTTAILSTSQGRKQTQKLRSCTGPWQGREVSTFPTSPLTRNGTWFTATTKSGGRTKELWRNL